MRSSLSLVLLSLGFASMASAQSTEPPAGVVATPAEADATVMASEESSAARARTPKVAIVIAGDPDPATVAAATRLESTLASDARVTMPSDPAIRAALRGEGGGDGSADGLDEVRAERRHLGLGEAHDSAPLTVLGEVAGADLVLVVRSSHGTTHATAFDVLRRAFYDGELSLDPLDEHAADFVARRAQRAARPLARGETTNPPATEATAPSVDPSAAVPPEAIAATPTPAQPHERDFFEQYWPYFAAGALLIGAVVFVVLATTSSSTPPPVLRFEAGGGQ